MKIIITEKPSVAREIAVLLGASEKRDGYLTGNGYFVTWALGHLVGLGMPEDYGISGFQKTSLPILPDPFLLTVRKIKKDNTYIVDLNAVQMRVKRAERSEHKGHEVTLVISKRTRQR